MDFWARNTEPFLSFGHDKVREALATFFGRAGGWRAIPQAAIAQAAHTSRPTANGKLQDLVAVGNIEAREQTKGGDGKREYEYRLAGEDSGWFPWQTGRRGRETVDTYLNRRNQEKRIEDLEAAVLALALATVVKDLPDSLIT